MALNWIQMSEQLGANRAVFDLCEQRHQGGGEAAEGQSSDSQLIALHSVIEQSKSGQGGVLERGSQNSIATLLMFHTVGCNLTPCSKI